jgi:hypothetical protein
VKGRIPLSAKADSTLRPFSVTEKTVQDTLNLLIKALSLCVVESKDKVAQTLLSTLKSLAVSLCGCPKGKERDLRTMRGLVLLIKERLEGIDALGVTLCDSLAEVLLQLILKGVVPTDGQPNHMVEGDAPAAQVVLIGGKRVFVPEWAIQAHQLWKQGLSYAEIGKRLGVIRQNVRYWVTRLETLNSKFKGEPSEHPISPPTPPTPNPTPPTPDETLWQLIEKRVKG